MALINAEVMFGMSEIHLSVPVPVPGTPKVSAACAWGALSFLIHATGAHITECRIEPATCDT